jgi:predicted RNase H-like HicB family nuclease
LVRQVAEATGRLSNGGTAMTSEFTAIIERDGEWYIAYCPEISGANSQGRTKEEARTSLVEAIKLILDAARRPCAGCLPTPCANP